MTQVHSTATAVSTGLNLTSVCSRSSNLTVQKRLTISIIILSRYKTHKVYSIYSNSSSRLIRSLLHITLKTIHQKALTKEKISALLPVSLIRRRISKKTYLRALQGRSLKQTDLKEKQNQSTNNLIPHKSYPILLSPS